MKNATRGPRPNRLWEGLGKDLRIALRGHLRKPGFALLTVLTLGLGMGANTAVFSVVDGVLLRPLPYPEPERIVRVREVAPDGHTMDAAYANFLDWRREADGFAALAAYSAGVSTVLGAERPARARTAWVSADFFATFRVGAAAGRLPAAAEHRLGAPPVAVVSHRFWRSHLGSAPPGERTLDLEGLAAQVVGVLPPGFGFPDDSDVWVPLELWEMTESRTAHNARVVGRLADGATLAAAAAEVDGITAALGAAEPGPYMAVGARLETLLDATAAPVERPLMLLLAAAGLVLLVACTNLASTFLARGTERRHELTVRSALGATPGRLRAQLFVESLALAACGAAVGVGVAALIVRALPRLAPATVPRLAEVALDGRVLVFTGALTVLAALLFGLLPSFQIVSARAAETLRGSARTVGADRRRRRTWRLLVSVQVALAVLLLCGAGLLLRSFWHLLDQGLGFDTRGVVAAEVSLPPSRYAEDAAVGAFWDRALAELAALPGVEAAGLVNHPPLGRWDPTGQMDVEGGPSPTVDAAYRVAGGGYFRALGIPVLAGRTFDARDAAGAADVVVVNRALAELAWPGRDPLGRRMTSGGMDSYWQEERWATVIGVVGDVRHHGAARAPGPEAYFAHRQRPAAIPDATLVLRTAAGSEAAAAASAAAALRRLDPEVPVETARLDALRAGSLADRRFALLLLGAFALLALVLAATGIYGVVAYAVARRRREMGIRMALGATPRQVRNLVVGRSMATVAVGLALGVAASLPLTRVLSGLLYEVRPTDPVTFAGVLVLLGGAGWMASLLPARRATATDPSEALRIE